MASDDKKSGSKKPPRLPPRSGKSDSSGDGVPSSPPLGLPRLPSRSSSSSLFGGLPPLPARGSSANKDETSPKPPSVESHEEKDRPKEKHKRPSSLASALSRGLPRLGGAEPDKKPAAKSEAEPKPPVAPDFPKKSPARSEAEPKPSDAKSSPLSGLRELVRPQRLPPGVTATQPIDLDNLDFEIEDSASPEEVSVDLDVDLEIDLADEPDPEPAPAPTPPAPAPTMIAAVVPVTSPSPPRPPPKPVASPAPPSPRASDSGIRSAPPPSPPSGASAGSSGQTKLGVPSPSTPAAPSFGGGERARPRPSETLRTNEGTPAPLVDYSAATGAEPFVEQASLLIRDWQGELGGKPDLFRAARLHYEIGRLWEHPIGDLAKAATAYQKSLGLSADHLPSLVGARRVLLAQRDYAKALPLFDAEVKISADPSHKAALIYAKGRVLEDSMGKEPEARAAYASALELAPANASVLKALERIDHRTSNWSGLEKVYGRVASSVELDPRHRAAIIIRRAHLLETRTCDSEMAVELYETALELDERAVGAYAALKRLHHGKARWRELIHVLEREAKHTEDREVRAMAHYRVARLHSERLGNRDLAITSLERSVKEVPENRLALEELVELYRSAQRFDAMAATLDRMVQRVESPSERISLFYRLGELYEGPLDDEDSAIRWYEASLAAEPAYLPGLRALSKLYTRREAWDALIAMNLAEAEAIQDSLRKAGAFLRVAELFERHKGDPRTAIEHHARALSLDPTLAASFKALVRLYTDSKQYRELIELYERGIDGAENDAIRIAYLFRIGDIYIDNLRDPVQAMHSYRRILKIDANHLGSIHALQRAADQAGRTKDLVEALELEASKTREESRVIVLLHRAAELLDSELDDRDGALARLRRILEIDGSYQPALASAGRLYFRSGRWEDLYRTYEQELAIAEPGRATVALLHTMGALAEEKLGRVEQAIECYRRASKADPKHGPSLEALARILSEGERWRDLIAVLNTQLRGLVDPRARAATAYRIGRIYEERQSSLDKALAAYQRAIESKPDFRPALDGVARVRALQESWPGVVDDLAREASTAVDKALSIAALLRAGEVWSEHLQQPERAIASYEAVLEIDPENLAALFALESLYREKSAWNMLADVYARQAQILRDDGARIAALRELARIQISRGGGIDAALDTFAGILEVDPNDYHALVATERTALNVVDDELLSFVDARLVETPSDRSLLGAHQTRLGESQERLGQLRVALAAYETALGHDSESLAAMYGMIRVATTLDEPRALVFAKTRLAKVERDGKVAAELLTDIAKLRLQRLDDVEGTVHALEEAIERWPDHVAAAGLLDEILLSNGQAETLIERLGQAAESARSDARASELWARVAELYAEHLDNLPGSIAVLRRSLRDRPDHSQSHLLLGDLFGRNTQWSESASEYRKVLAGTTNAETTCLANRRLAICLAEHLDDLAGAREAMAKVLAIMPDDRDTLLLLTDYHARARDVEAATEGARQLLRVSTSREDRIDAIIHLFRVELTLGRREQAREVLLNAVILEGPGGLASREYAGFVRNEADWERYEEALLKFLRQSEQEGSPVVPTYLAIAEVQAERLGTIGRAISTLEQGLANVGESEALRVELARWLRIEGRLPEAIRAYQQLLQRHPASAPGWRGLFDSYSSAKRAQEATLTLAPLCILGEVSEHEARVMHSSVPRAPVGNTGLLHPDNYRPLVDRSDHGAIAERLLAIIDYSLARLYPIDLEAYGVSSRDKITSRSNDPLRGLADRVAQIFAVPDFEMYMIRSQGTRISLDFGAAPALLIPASVLRLNETQQVFVLARALADVARGLHPLSKFKAQDLMLILAAAARASNHNYGSTLADGGALNELNRRIIKALPRKDRKACEDVAAAYASAPPIDFGAWVHDNVFAATRVASLVAGDLVLCVEVLRQEDPALAYLEGEDMVGTSEVIADLMRYWCSDASLELRRRLAKRG